MILCKRYIQALGPGREVRENGTAARSCHLLAHGRRFPTQRGFLRGHRLPMSQRCFLPGRRRLPMTPERFSSWLSVSNNIVRVSS